jgi:hypothetical protein
MATQYIFGPNAPGIRPAPKRPDDLSRRGFGARTGYDVGLNDYQAKLSPIEKPSGGQARK